MLAVDKSSFDELVAEMDMVTHPVELRSVHHSSFAIAHLLQRNERQIETERE